MKWFSLLLFLDLFFHSFLVKSQVNPQNGAAQASVALYNYSDPGNRLGLNANLTYVDGNGLKVSEMASAVGTGWTLNCGGYITRIQHGEPDDQYDPTTYDYVSEFSEYVSNYFPNGYLYTSALPTNSIDNGGAYSTYLSELPSDQKYYKAPPQYVDDLDQDVFQFNFNGRTGEFVIGKNLQPVTLIDSKLQISFQQAKTFPTTGIRTTITQFTITDETGIQYVFKDLELAYVSQYTDLRVVTQDNQDITQIETQPYSAVSKFTNNGQSVDVVLGVPNGQFVVSKWYLSQIINPFTGKSITFNYSTYEEDINSDKVMNNVETNSTFSNVTVFWNHNKVRGKRLSSVTLSPNEQLTFTYSPSPRIDLPHENALTQILVSYKGTPVYSWNFGYGYMVGIDGAAIQSPTYSYSPTETAWSRLCLLTLQKSGYNDNAGIPVSEPPYQFAYNLGGDNHADVDVVPPMFSIYQDSYGYYNAGVAETTPFEGSITNFYPISGLNNFVTNGLGVYHDVYSTVAKNGILKSVIYPTGGSLSFSYENNATPAGSIGGVRVNQTTQYDGISHGNDVIKNYLYVNSDEATSSGWGGETYVYTMNGTGIANGCVQSESPSVKITGVASYLAQQTILSISAPTVATALGATTLVAEISQYATYAAIAYDIYTLIFTPNPPTVTASYTVRQTQNLTANNPLPSGYTRVEVVSMLPTSTAGETVYTFSNPIGTGERPIDYPTMSVPYSNKPRYAPWVYGLPESTTVMDNTGKKVKQTVNHFTYIVNVLANSNFVSKSWTAIGTEYACTYNSPDNASTLISQETYFPFTGHTVLTSTDETLFNAAQQPSTVTTNYDYDNNFQLKDKYTNNSKGELIETYYYYPYSYPTAGGAIGVMNSNGVLGPIISSETYLSPLSGGTYLTAATAINFAQAYNGDLLPQTRYELQSTAPLSSSTLQTFNPSSVVRDPTYYQPTTSLGYDNYGNVVQTITGGNRVVSNLFDYDGKLMVATVMNASYNDIGYTSFEAEGGKPMSWVNSAAIVSTDARTGSSCFNLSDPSNSSSFYTVNGDFGFGGLNSTLTYIVSYWSKNGTPCLVGTASGQSVVNTCQGGSGWKQGATVNGWTYFEVQVSNIDQIAVNGSGLVDEFRVYPVGALMTTTTYQPLIGKSSVCDAAGKVTYYQYDELGRLKYVMDDQKNIIKEYDYNYKQ